MRTILGKILPVGLALVSLALAGCLLISGTFIVTEDLTFDDSENFAFKAVDLTENSDWQDHKDDIDQIDAVGFTMTVAMTNGGATKDTFNLYVAPYTGATAQYSNKGELDDKAYPVIKDLVVPVGTSTITYQQSLSYLRNLDKLKELVKTGRLHCYATSSTTGSFVVNPGSIVITLTANK